MTDLNNSHTGSCLTCGLSVRNTENTHLIQHGRRNSRYSTLLFLMLLFLLFVACTLGFYLIITQTRGWHSAGQLSMITRASWKARRPNNYNNLSIPCDKILLLQINSSACYDDCATQIYNMQQLQMRRNESDILYNFILGRDGKIYEGRGWKYASPVIGKDNATIVIALLGSSRPTYRQKNQLLELIELGLMKNRITPCFQVLTKTERSRYLIDIAIAIQDEFGTDKCLQFS